MSSPDASQGGGSFLATWGILIPLFLIMYLLLIRPQRKRQKEHEKLLTELKKGDRVVTNSGMFGTIFAIYDDKNKVVLKITDDIKVEFLKSSIAGKVD
ncbi:MAG: preprotein translocase subunit YajC [Candidatus Zixiibacteriota bacterium]|nr:MAG: preprotein translocase subunit YajC [candidate division Zixibacteria bacterium]